MSNSQQQRENEAPDVDPRQLPTTIARATGAALAANSDSTPPPRSSQSNDDAPASKRDASQYPGSYRPEDARAYRNTSTSQSSSHDWNRDTAEQAQQTDSAPPPAYTENLGIIEEQTEDLGTRASVADDGRVNIRISQSGNRLSSYLVPSLQKQAASTENDAPLPPPYIPPSLGGDAGEIPPPPMNVVIHVVGSRGDVQPFVALGKVLKDTYGHRVRLATHPVFKTFVEENGLEFFSIGGDPSELMAFMVKNPGLMPGFDVLRSGDIGSRRRGIAEMIKGCWRSCIETGDGFGIEATDNNVDELLQTQRDPNQPLDQAAELAARPFIADAIIANPPSFAHVHCAEKLGVPLHMMFTMPWSPTQAFPHPLANIQSSNAEPNLTNYMSYTLVDMLTWQGLGDLINRFRKESLGLDPVSLIWAPGMLHRMKIPYTYCWSPALIPKPRDWSNWISISGFYFLNLASNYRPEPELDAFLKAGPPPVYIGFGSIVVDDPNAMTKLIFDAVRATGQRALVSKGWGGFGVDELGIPEGVFMLGNVPHDWLFKQVSCVVHHGGAGTTAAGIAAGRPTVVVPFFGDQPFWGAMVARAGAGPDPIHHKDLNADNLAAAINKCLEQESQDRAQELCDKIKAERGCDQGAQSFHQLLQLDGLRCSLAPSRMGVWRVKRTDVRLSALAATVLAEENEISFNDLKLYRARDYIPDNGPPDPISAASTALIGTMSTMMMGIADMPVETLKALRIHPETKKSKSQAKQSLSGSSAAQSTDTLQQTVSSSSTNPDRSNSLDKSPFGASAESIPRVQSPDQDGVATPTASDRQSSVTSTSRPPGNSRQSSSSNIGPDRSAEGQENAKPFDFTQITSATAMGTGKGVQRIANAAMKSPMDFSLALAQGFHNASRLYGDEPRQVEKVTSFSSGMKVAGTEFGRGIFDGITGLVRDPYKGAKKEGAAGFVKGIGKGIAGVVLKPNAAVFALPAYTFKGIYSELAKPFGASVQNYIIAARTAQGYEDMLRSSAEERADIVKRWRVISKNVKRKKNPGEDQIDSLQKLLEQYKEQRRQQAAKRKDSTAAGSASPSRFGFLRSHSRQLSGAGSLAYTPSESASIANLYDASTQRSDPRSPTLSHNTSASQSTTAPAPVSSPHSSHARTFPVGPDSRPLSELEDTGPQPELATEEEWIERAMQASLAESSASPHDAQEEADLQAAIRASQAEHSSSTSKRADDQDELVERALQASIDELKAAQAAGTQSSLSEEDMLKRAMAASLAEASEGGMSAEEQRELAQAMRNSVVETQRKKSIRRHVDRPKARLRSSDSEWDDSDEDEDNFAPDDEVDFEKRGSGTGVSSVPDVSSQKMDRPGGVAGGDDEELKRALAESQQAADDEQRKEQIVLEHVMKQSLLEDEAKRRAQSGQGLGGESSRQS